MKLSNLISKNPVTLLELNLILFLLVLIHPTSTFSLPSDYDLNRPVYAFEFLNYRSSGNGTYLEVFGQISTNNLIFVRSKDGFVASYELSITLYDQLNKEVVETSFIDSVSVKTFWDIERFRPPQLLRFPLFLKPGLYKARVRFTDQETRLPWDFEKNVTIADFNNSDLLLSELQIATSISLSNEESVLVKNGRKVVPNVLRIVEMGSDEMYVYSEIYNLQYSLNELNDEFIATYAIENKKGEEVRSFQLRHKKPGDTCALSVAIPVQELAEGEYRLILTVGDPVQAQSVHKSINFYVVGPYSEPHL